ncbi:hypothetical protein EIP91_008166 [Steccherinum ochraceum]|uniref:Uncharacterized protein n=1 Tax=Steccherinum ochraceum TaxID=92696 RepID=A0A4R0R366_9APHY|nr:hypothetical protein EIP91_008166 [Steccherinum ochraceum]
MSSFEKPRPLAAESQIINRRSDEADVIAVREELRRTQERLEALQEYVRELECKLERKISPCSSLNFDTLYLIFQYLLPPSVYLDPSISAGPNSLWCRVLRMKKTLTLVSKFWRRVALPFLYGEVWLRRFGQMVSFARTVKQSCDEIAPLVKTVSFTCYVPAEDLVPLASQSAVTILTRCPDLTGLKFSTDFLERFLPVDANASSETGRPMVVNALSDLGPRMTMLHSEDAHLPRAPAVYPHSLLSSFPMLRSLILVLDTDKWAEDVAPLTFNHLEHLAIQFRDALLPFARISAWKLPRLRRLGFDMRHASKCPRRDSVSFAAFFKAYGLQIQELDFGPSADVRSLPLTSKLCGCTIDTSANNQEWSGRHMLWVIQSVVALCPRVQYIALPALRPHHVPLSALLASWHPSIRIDLWGEDASDVPSSSESPFHPNIRMIDIALSSTPDIARVFNRPIEDNEPRPILHRVYDSVRLVDGPLALHRPDWEQNWPLLLRRAAKLQLTKWVTATPDLTNCKEDGYTVVEYASSDESGDEDDGCLADDSEGENSASRTSETPGSDSASESSTETDETSESTGSSQTVSLDGDGGVAELELVELGLEVAMELSEMESEVFVHEEEEVLDIYHYDLGNQDRGCIAYCGLSLEDGT